MNRSRTVISDNNMAFLEEDKKSPREIVEFLKDGAMFRSFAQVLEQVCPYPGSMEKLTEGLASITGREKESVARRIRNWRKEGNGPSSRETLFQICFVLELDEAQANRVIGAASDTGIHYRNPVELAYTFGLRKGMPWEKARELADRAEALFRRYRGEGGRNEGKQFYTRQIKNAFLYVEDEEEFFDFLEEYGPELGMLHETAYEKFMELMELLTKPEGKNGVAEERFTMDRVVEDYIRMKVPQGREKKSFTPLQKLVKKYWPNETSLLNMKNKKEDVSRKALLLLYMVTEAFDEPQEAEGCYDADDGEEDPDTRLEIRIEKMQLFLNSFGMNLLDPGSPFDFLALYAMRTQEGEYVSDRMDAAVGELFA